MIRYFAYGSNLRRARLEDRVGRVELCGVAWLADYTHRFNKRGMDGTAKGNIEPADGSKVWGVVYGIDVEQKAILDRIEGGYRAQALTVNLARDGSAIEVLSYFGIELDHRLRPRADYLEHYLAGAREHRIPDDYLRSILPAWFLRAGES